MKLYTCTPEADNPLRVFGLLPYYDGEGFPSATAKSLKKSRALQDSAHAAAADASVSAPTPASSGCA